MPAWCWRERGPPGRRAPTAARRLRPPISRGARQSPQPLRRLAPGRPRPPNFTTAFMPLARLALAAAAVGLLCAPPTTAGTPPAPWTGRGVAGDVVVTSMPDGAGR